MCVSLVLLAAGMYNCATNTHHNPTTRAANGAKIIAVDQKRVCNAPPSRACPLPIITDWHRDFPSLCLCLSVQSNVWHSANARKVKVFGSVISREQNGQTNGQTNHKCGGRFGSGTEHRFFSAVMVENWIDT